MSHSFRSWKILPSDHKDYVFIYIAGFIWATVYFFFSPATTYSILNQATVYLWTIVTALGAVLAVIGLLTRDNLLMERLGVTLLMTGPIVYSLTQLGLFIYGLYGGLSSDPFDRIHLIFLALWPFFFLNKRRRQIKKQVREAKKIPLQSETPKGL